MSVTYSTHVLSDLKVETQTVSKNNRVSNKSKVTVDGVKFNPSQRFWNSVGSRFGMSTRLFKYFTPEEVLTRVTEVSVKERKSVEIRLAVKDGELLAISDPKQKILMYDDLMEFLEKNGGEDVRYHNGILTSMFTPNGGHQSFDIGPDKFNHRFMTMMPVDGYGNFTNALALLRQICTNGMVAMTPAFQSNLKLGQTDGLKALSRAINSFSHDDGYTVLEHRFQVAQQSIASVAEVVRAKATLERLVEADEDSKLGRSFGVTRKLSDLTGNLNYMYGTSNLTTLGKKQKILPSKCTIYDLMNFLTEYATHHDKPAAQKINGLVGSYLSSEYDLENTKTKAEDFEGMFLKDEKLLSVDGFTEGSTTEEEEEIA